MRFLSKVTLLALTFAAAGTLASTLELDSSSSLSADETPAAKEPAAKEAGKEDSKPAATETGTATANPTDSASASASESNSPAPLKSPEKGGVSLIKHAEAATGEDGNESAEAADMVAELRRRREAADAREKALDAREAELKSREAALESELKKLQGVRDDINKVEESRKKENDDRVAKIVETVETMSPKSAAPLLVAMDEPLAVAAMGKIATPKLAKILNLMEPRKSARLSELLAGVVRAKNAEGERNPARATASNGAAEATAKSAKGGE